ncbi:hypothetical protein DFJ74DRAFT_683957 [Hyaloraphidium curvatum]|nr:hypothetical protein DFJ74DRAFT_683957 [Hyaloraphidium curvatum]
MPLGLAATLLALLCASGALAAPLEAPAAGAIFARSCGDCPTSHFCEYGYEGTPRDSVACVPAAARHELYRRYDDPTACTDATSTGQGATKICEGGNDFTDYGCYPSTGAIVPSGSSSAPGACRGAQNCCVPASAVIAELAVLCGTSKPCVDGANVALTIQDLQYRSCDPTTGALGGSYECSRYDQSMIAACCSRAPDG